MSPSLVRPVLGIRARRANPGRRAAIAGLVGVIALLGALGIVGAVVAERAAESAANSRAQSQAFVAIRYALSQEESLERKYRLEPAQGVRDAHRAASADLVSNLQRIAQVGDGPDRVLAQRLLAEHGQYVDSTIRMFALVDAGNAEAADAIDFDAMDPAFEAMQQRVDSAASAHVAEAGEASADLVKIQRAALFVIPSVLALGFIAVAYLWRFLRRQSTELRLAERRVLEKSERRFRGLIQRSADVILLLDADARITYCSPSFEKLFDYPQSAAVGRNCLDFVDPPERDRARGLFRRSNDHPEEIQTADLGCRGRSGTRLVLEVAITNLLDDPSVGGVVVNGHDVTARRMAEDGLRRNERLLRDSQRAARIGSFELELRTGAWQASEVLGEIVDLDHVGEPGSRPTAAVAVAVPRSEIVRYLRDEVAGGGQRFDRELPVAGPDYRTELWLHVIGELEVDGNDAPLRVVGTIQDVTERKRAEALLLHSQKMESVGRLAGGIAHDFNNLLTAVVGYGTLAASAAETPPEVRQDIESALAAANKAAALTAQLLSFARQQVVQPKDIDLNDAVASLERLLQPLIGDDVSIVRFPDPWPILARIDPGQFEQVIVNLAVNARDAMPDGGTLIVATRVVEITSRDGPRNDGLPPGRYGLVEVSDTGTGMTKEVRDHLFEPFFTTKETGKGTGLGLATSFGIVKQAGGHLTVESERGRGATFRIYLPAAVAAADDVTGSDKPAIEANAGNVSR